MLNQIRSSLSRALQKGLVKDTAWTTVFSVVGKSIGLLIPFFIAAWFGVSSATDAFFFAYSVILFLAQIFSPVVERVVVPFVAELRSKGETADNFLSRVLGLSAVGLLAITFVLIVISKPVIGFVTRFSEEELRLVLRIIVESSGLIVLVVWTSILAGALNAHQKFAVPAFSPAFRAIVTLAFIFVFKAKMGVHAIAYGYVVGEAIRFVILSVASYKLGIFHFRLSVKWDEKLLAFFKTSSYQIFGMSVLSFVPIINKAVASWLEPGSVTLFQYAERLYMIPTTLLSSGFLVTLLSYWSKQRHEKNEALGKAVSITAIVLGVFALAFTALFLAFRVQVVGIAYGHGKLSANEIGKVQDLIAFQILGLVPYYSTQVFVTAFIAQRETRVLFFAAILITAATIGFDVFLIPKMGISGLAASQSIAAFFALVFVYVYFQLWNRK